MVTTATRGWGTALAMASALLLVGAGSAQADGCSNVATVRNSTAQDGTCDPGDGSGWGGMQDPPACPHGWAALASYNITTGMTELSSVNLDQTFICTIEVLCGLDCTGAASGGAPGADFLSDAAAQVLALVSAATNTLILAVLLAMHCKGQDGAALAAKPAGYSSLQ